MSVDQKERLPAEIRNFAEWQLIHYQENAMQLEHHKKNPGESELDIKQLEISVGAIRRVIEQLPEEDKKLIQLAYWGRRYTVTGAGMLLYMSQSTAYRHVNKILEDIAREMGYIR